jgi:hypothetical protein
MEEKTKNEAIEAFLKQGKIELNDEAFTQKVMGRLPEKKRPNFVVYLSLLAGLATAYFVGGLEKFVFQLALFFNSVIKFQVPPTNTILISTCVCISVGLSYALFNPRRKTIWA